MCDASHLVYEMVQYFVILVHEMLQYLVIHEIRILQKAESFFFWQFWVINSCYRSSMELFLLLNVR